MQSFRPEIRKAVHGSITPGELRSLGLSAADVLDFSANINPLGVSPRVAQALAEVDVARYPDPECLELREALSKATGVETKNILVGNGSTELIHLLAQAYLMPGDNAAIFAPTFGEYELACRITGVSPTLVEASERDDFRWNIARICDEIEQLRPRLAFLCNPNNPTGLYLDDESVRRIAAATAPGILAIDEAYLPFAEEPWDSTALLEMDNVVILRSMTKDHALTGLRLGYLLAPEEISEASGGYQPTWSVNSAAQVAGLAAISETGHVLRARELVAEIRAYLYAELAAMGLRAIPSSVNFLLVRVGDAGTIRSALLKRGLCVRDCTSFGLPQHIRIAVRTLPECKRLVSGLKEICVD